MVYKHFRTTHLVLFWDGSSPNSFSQILKCVFHVCLTAKWSKFSSHNCGAPHHRKRPNFPCGTWTIHQQVYFLPIYTKRCFGLLLSTDANLSSVHHLTTGFILKAPWVQTRVFRPELLAEEGTSAAPLLVLAMSSTTLRTTSTRMGQEGGMSHCRELQVLSFGFRMSYPAILEDCKACHLSFKVTLPNHIWNKWCVFGVHTNPYLRKCAHCNFDCMYVIIWLLFIQENLVPFSTI